MFTRMIIPLAFLLGCYACSESPSKEGSPQPVQPGLDIMRTFQFSSMITATGSGNKDNWCHQRFPDAVLVNAPPDNSNQRYFDLKKDVYKIVVSRGKVTTSFLVRNPKDGPLEVFTSDNFPECLSRRSNFSLGDNETSLRYDNQLNISFEVRIQPNGAFRRMTIDFPFAAGYGLAVHGCFDCQ